MTHGTPEIRGPSWWDPHGRWRAVTASPTRLRQHLTTTASGGWASGTRCWWLGERSARLVAERAERDEARCRAPFVSSLRSSLRDRRCVGGW